MTAGGTSRRSSSSGGESNAVSPGIVVDREAIGSISQMLFPLNPVEDPPATQCQFASAVTGEIDPCARLQ